METIKIGIVDDHKLVSKALENLISFIVNFKVTMNCFNGQDFMDQLRTTTDHPDVVLMDINMPIKNGIEATQEVSKEFPNIKVIALTMEDNETTIIRMLKAGAKGYLLKDMSPDILFDAIDIVNKQGTFYTDLLTQSLLKIKTEEKLVQNLNDSFKSRELEFIKLSCSELTYREIADQMSLSPRTIDGYRDSVFIKLNVKTRVGVVLFAIRNNII